MASKPTDPRMKPKKMTVNKKVEAGKASPVKKKQSATSKSVPKVTGLRGKAYSNGQA